MREGCSKAVESMREGCGKCAGRLGQDKYAGRLRQEQNQLRLVYINQLDQLIQLFYMFNIPVKQEYIN